MEIDLSLQKYGGQFSGSLMSISLHLSPDFVRRIPTIQSRVDIFLPPSSTILRTTSILCRQLNTPAFPIAQRSFMSHTDLQRSNCIPKANPNLASIGQRKNKSPWWPRFCNPSHGYQSQILHLSPIEFAMPPINPRGYNLGQPAWASPRHPSVWIP
jgi:hypothetical protein